MCGGSCIRHIMSERAGMRNEAGQLLPPAEISALLRSLAKSDCNLEQMKVSLKNMANELDMMGKDKDSDHLTKDLLAQPTLPIRITVPKVPVEDNSSDGSTSWGSTSDASSLDRELDECLSLAGKSVADPSEIGAESKGGQFNYRLKNKQKDAEKSGCGRSSRSRSQNRSQGRSRSQSKQRRPRTNKHKHKHKRRHRGDKDKDVAGQDNLKQRDARTTRLSRTAGAGRRPRSSGNQNQDGKSQKRPGGSLSQVLQNMGSGVSMPKRDTSRSGMAGILSSMSSINTTMRNNRLSSSVSTGAVSPRQHTSSRQAASSQAFASRGRASAQRHQRNRF